MLIKLQYPRILWKGSKGELDITIDRATVGDLLEELLQIDPDLYRNICDETGKLRPHVNLFINDRLFDRNRFETRLKSGDVVQVFQSVSGG